MRLRRGRFDDLVKRQLDIFAEEEADLLEEADAAERAYDEAAGKDAEEAYADFQLVLEAGTDRLREIVAVYRSTLDDDAADEYEAAFVKAALKRFRKLAVGLAA